MTRIRGLHAISLALLLFALVNFFGIYAAIHVLAPKDLRVSSASYTRAFLAGSAGDDSWGPMQAALDRVRTAPAEPLYETLFFKEKVKFQYLPSSLLTLDLLDHFFGHRIAFNALNRVSWVCVVILAVFVPAAYLIALRKFSPTVAGQFRTSDIALQAVTLSLMTISFTPITQGFFLGNIQTWLTCLFAGSVLAWISGYELTAGILIGLIITVKPQLVLLLAWAIIRSRRRFLIGCTATLAFVSGISLLRYGLKNEIDYLSVLSFLSSHGESFYRNQSMNGLLARMLHIGNNTGWQSGEYPPFNPLVFYGTLLTSALMIGFSLFWGRTKTDGKSLLISFLAASLLITVASPIAWGHHYGIMVPIYACFLAILLEARPRRQWLIWTGVSYVLVSNVFIFTNLTADTRWNIIQSYQFAGAVLLIFTMYRYTAVTANPRSAEASAACD
jgi:alpha-1,2-mannosyltransferase